jgi:hypothetical protein
VFRDINALNHVLEQNSCRWYPAASRVGNDLRRWGGFEKAFHSQARLERQKAGHIGPATRAPLVLQLKIDSWRFVNYDPVSVQISAQFPRRETGDPISTYQSVFSRDRTRAQFIAS